MLTSESSVRVKCSLKVNARGLVKKMGKVDIPKAIVTTLCAFTKIIAAKAMISFQTREIGCTIEAKDNIRLGV